MIKVKEIIAATGGNLFRGEGDAEIKNFSLDSRTLISGDVFIPVKGTRVDGHRFIEEAVSCGARGIVAERSYSLPAVLPEIVIQVEDTIKALGRIAAGLRTRFSGPVIAVTGTTGKTTSKEIIAAVLGKQFQVLKNRGTLNNHIGVPLTLLGLDRRYDLAVVEMGMNAPGEIKYLSQIIQPDVGVITNIGPAHLEKLYSVKEVCQAKAELLEVMGEKGLVILNRDDKYFDYLQEKTHCRQITIGRDARADFQAVDIAFYQDEGIRFKLLAKPFHDILEIRLPIIGLHNIYPALLAAVVAYGLELKPELIVSGLEEITTPPMRLELKEISGIKVLDDCYNANPLSMKSALETLSLFKSEGRKIFVCGDMLELGLGAAEYHRKLGRQVAGGVINYLVTIGQLARLVSDTAREEGVPAQNIWHCEDKIAAVSVLSKLLEPGDIVLVKGSRANRMEEITRGIEEYYQTLERLIV